MYRVIQSFVAIFMFFICSGLQASESELQGYGAFTQLNKDWMLLALYSESKEDASQTATPQRLVIKIETEKFSPRRFRQLWLETMAVEHGPKNMAKMQSELKQFFNILKGPLEQGDALIIERTEIDGLPITDVTLNFHSLARLSEGFLGALVQSLTGKHPPTQLLKSGLMGEQSIRNQMSLAIRFDRLEPSLPRIAEVSRWSKRINARTEIVASK